MNDGLPAPLTPPDCDLSDYRFMPLEVSRLRRSKAWVFAKRKPALGFYMVNLWMAAWHEVPAGSLDDDDDVLADAAMCDVRRWKAVRNVVLRGWIKCSDGRLYHPVVAEKAQDSYETKKKMRKKGLKGAVTRWASEPEKIELGENSEQNQRGSDGTGMPRAMPDQCVGNAQAMPGDSKGIEGKGIEEREVAKPLPLGTQSAREAEVKPRYSPEAVAAGAAMVAKEKARWERLGLDWNDQPVEQMRRAPDPMRTGMADLKTVDGHPTCNGYHVDVVFGACCEAARIPEVSATLATWQPVIDWLAEGYESGEILRVIRTIADRPGYKVPRSLGYFSNAIRDEAKPTQPAIRR